MEEIKDSIISFKKMNDDMIATNSMAYKGDFAVQKTARPYTIKQIEDIISYGSCAAQQELSNTFFYSNGIYKRIIMHYASLLQYVGILIPNASQSYSLSNSGLQKRYYKALNLVEIMNIPVFASNCAMRALINGGYYGVIQSLSKDVFSVLDLPSEYCRSRYKDEKGNSVIEFDITYFNTITDIKERNLAFNAYPKNFSKYYEQYTKGKIKSKWFLVPTDIGICIPFFDGRPPFINILPSIMQYEDTVEIEGERALEEIRKLLVLEIPHLNDGRLLFEHEEALEMHKGAVGMLRNNKNISVLTTYANGQILSTKTASEATVNSLKNMRDNVFAKSGTSPDLFASSGSTTLKSSLDNDLAFMMLFANKISLFITNFINRQCANSTINFKYKILPISYYNYDDYINSSFKLASSGYSYLLPALALGINQQDIGNIKDLENNVLKLSEKLQPLKSSYTQSSSSTTTEEVGRPSKEAEEKTEETIKKEESLNS